VSRVTTSNREVNIRVPVLARVEGEGALELQARNGQIEELRLRIFEPPRLFEKFLEGRSYREVLDIVARICGICPVAYQMTAVRALESVCRVEPTPWVRTLRRVMYCGEWIQSHALHIHMLAAPDFLGIDNVAAMAQRYPSEVRRGLRLQELGNRIMRTLGGRSVHPVSVCVGGFTKAPARVDMVALLQDLKAALPEAEALIRWTAALNLPEDSQDFVSVALSHPACYAIDEGRLRSTAGLDIDIVEYPDHFSEFQVPHSTAFHSHLHGAPYLVGPLARLNLNGAQLPMEVRKVVADCGIHFPSRNMFHSIVARAVEIYYALGEAARLLEAYTEPTLPNAPAPPLAGVGIGCTEAPRGTLWQRYTLDPQGIVQQATIIPPTSQNQARMEDDLRWSLQAFGLDHADDVLRLRSETVIRNYDPCISCATHFLKIQVDRRA
jgi:sulfhydrogenase subunit alpha